MSKKNLDKIIGTTDILMIAFGAMIGWGWVVASGSWILDAGVLGTVLGFIIGGIMIYFVGLTYAELTTAMPQSGGVHVFTNKAFGHKISFLTTWTMILSYVGVVCFEACSLPTVIQYIFPEFIKGYLYTVNGFDVYLSWLVIAVFFSVLITYINVIGLRTAAKLQTILTMVIGGIGILLVIFSAINGSASNLDGQLFKGESLLLITENIFSVAVVAPFFLFGFDVIPQVAEEINLPLKKVGRLLLFSIILAVMFYALVVLAVGYALSAGDILQAEMGTGLVTAVAMKAMFNSDVMAKVMIIGGVCGIVTSWNSFLIGGSRAIYALAKVNMLPSVFAKLSGANRTPVNALLLIGTLSVIAPFFGRSMLVWIANVASLACCIAYTIVAMAFIRLREKEPELHRPFKITNYKAVGYMAVALSGCMVFMYILPNTGCTLNIQEWVILLAWTVLGLSMAMKQA